MSHFLGFDLSTQSLSVMILDPVSGTLVHESSINFGKDLPQYQSPQGYLTEGAPDEVFADPLMWLEAFDQLLGQLVEAGVDLAKVAAVSGSGQQHASVYLKPGFDDLLAGLDPEKTLVEQFSKAFSRSQSPIWMDSSTSQECQEIAQAAGGNQRVCELSGSVATERFTGPQIRKFSREQAYEGTSVIHLVSSFFASILAGKSVDIDHGDGAGMNLMNLSRQDWDEALLEATAPGLAEKLPGLSPSSTAVGKISNYLVQRYGFSPTCRAVLWSGDNPCSLVGMGAAQPNQIVISLGTSDTLFAAMEKPVVDPNGWGHVFGNPMGGYMSLICFKNGSLAREAVKDELSLSWDDFGGEILSQTPVGNEGLLMLPFFEDEITPRVATGGPVLSQEGEISDSQKVRAVLEGQFLNMRLHSAWLGIQPDRVLLTGGASRNDGIAQVVANIFNAPVERLKVAGSAALGAAIRAAVAVGEDLSSLEGQFCKADEGQAIQPDADAAQRYDELLPSFEALLARASAPS